MMALPDEVNRNSIRFADCRRFAGESTLSFNDPVLTEASAPAKRVEEVEIPAGLTLQLLMPELDLMHAAVGDPIHATLQAAAKKPTGTARAERQHRARPDHSDGQVSNLFRASDPVSGSGLARRARRAEGEL